MRVGLRRFFITALVAFPALFTVGVALLWHNTTPDLPFLISAVQMPPQTGEIIYLGETGKPFDRETAGISYRSLDLAEVDPELIGDLIAVEDRNFLQHRGVDFWRTMRAAVGFVLTGGKNSSGGSTLTQQVIKNLLSHHDRTVVQKAREILLAWRLESALSIASAGESSLSLAKKQILSAYWNHLFVTNRYRGLKNFTELVLKKSASTLTPYERILVLAIVRSPAAFASSDSRLRANVRRIESALERAGRFNRRERPNSLPDLSRWQKSYASLINGSVFLSEAAQPKTSLAKSLGNLFHLGIDHRVYAFTQTKVKTHRIDPLDEKLQQRLEVRLKNLNRGSTEKCSVTGAYLLLRLSDAAVIAAGEDGCSHFNELVQVRRQVSSTIKPFLYAYAFETTQLTPASIFDDRRVSVVSRDGTFYSPANHYKTFRGKMHLKNALQISANTISLQLFERVDKADFLRRLARAFARYPHDDVSDSLHADYSLALGSIDLSPVHVAAAYLSLLGKGQKIYPRWGSIAPGTMSQGEQDLPVPAKIETIFDPLASEQVREMLTAVLRPEGTGGEFMGPRDEIVIQELGAKSGSGPVDTWFVGYSQDVLLIVWLGFRQRSERARDFHAASLWYDLYVATLPWFRPKPMVFAPELEKRYFCAETGLLPSPGCRRIASALFRRDAQR